MGFGTAREEIKRGTGRFWSPANARDQYQKSSGEGKNEPNASIIPSTSSSAFLINASVSLGTYLIHSAENESYTTLRQAIFFSSVVGSSLFAQKLDCQKFRDGNFKIFDETTGTSIIRRKGNTQVETNDKYSLTLEFSVHWLDNCTYTLTPKKDMPELGIDTSQVLTVTITQTKERSYMQTTSSNFSSLKRTIEITKIEE